MNKEDVLKLLKANLGYVALDETTKYQLTHLIHTSCEMIRREGAILPEPFNHEDAQLVVMYAEYLYRKRATNEAMPRMLRFALNNKILSGKAREI